MKSVTLSHVCSVVTQWTQCVCPCPFGSQLQVKLSGERHKVHRTWPVQQVCHQWTPRNMFQHVIIQNHVMSLHSFKYHFQFFVPPATSLPGIAHGSARFARYLSAIDFWVCVGYRKRNSSTVRDRSTACSIGGLLWWRSTHFCCSTSWLLSCAITSVDTIGFLLLTCNSFEHIACAWLGKCLPKASARPAWIDGLTPIIKKMRAGVVDGTC